MTFQIIFQSVFVVFSFSHLPWCVQCDDYRVLRETFLQCIGLLSTLCVHTTLLHIAFGCFVHQPGSDMKNSIYSSAIFSSLHLPPSPHFLPLFPVSFSCLVVLTTCRPASQSASQPDSQPASQPASQSALEFIWNDDGLVLLNSLLILAVVKLLSGWNKKSHSFFPKENSSICLDNQSNQKYYILLR